MKNREVWIRIEKSIFEKSDFKDINFLTQIIRWSPTGSIFRYHYFVDTDIESIKKTENYKKLSEIDKLDLENSINDAVTSGKNKKAKYSVSSKNEKVNEFNLQESIRFFLSPVSIIIENSLNDSYFLKAIFSHFDFKDSKGKRKLIEFLNNDWIQFVNAGGWSNIWNYVEGRLESLKHFAQKNNSESQKYVRCFVLMDSDREHPTFDIANKEKLKNKLEELGIQVHILKKRAMENYIPDTVIEKLPEINNKYSSFKKWATVYKSLTSEQKDYLNYKKGFPKKEKEFELDKKKIFQKINKERNEQSLEIQRLYPESNIDKVQYIIIDNGLKEFPDFKDEFPKYFLISELQKIQLKYQNPFYGNTSLVNKTTLLSREGGKEEDNEFLEIIEKINNLL